MDTKNVILTSEQIAQKSRRIAYQIYESNHNEDEVVIAGIIGNGFLFAEKLATILTEISEIKVVLCKVNLDKTNPLSSGVTTSLPVEEYTNKPLILVDDVLNSGTTLIYGVKHFLDVPLKRFKTAVLVNRNHKKYPVKADFKGISLSTSTQEKVFVEFNDDKSIAYLL